MLRVGLIANLSTDVIQADPSSVLKVCLSFSLCVQTYCNFKMWFYQETYCLECCQALASLTKPCSQELLHKATTMLHIC